MSTATGRFSALPDEVRVAVTVVTVAALEEHGFSVEVVDDLDAAREHVLAGIPKAARNPSPAGDAQTTKGAIRDCTTTDVQTNTGHDRR